MGEVTLQIPIDTPKQVQKACDAMKDAPTIPSDLRSYSRPLWMVLKNKTQFSITPDGTYFYSGCLHGQSSNTGAYNVTGFGARNSWAGTTGGARFKIKLDQKNEVVFVIGFSNPVIGYYAAHIEESWDMEKAGYAKVQENGNNIESIHVYKGTSSSGSPLKFRLRLSIVSGQTMDITVVQDVWEEE
ncbi:uncharacterized protein N7498_004702 [Penicillium cinerascens]|uniref:Uncharacterized protein n=1 Tax=Penicillium cinerascens TaxID=70096 RepID=A0A9W9SZE3_9EURO|nr:uncharacterized protein N7498_004702 [Penicillium cinerascens]KAJ5203823.1 hypothetical protein N7498_004702 [Penicillium cinerascens]